MKGNIMSKVILIVVGVIIAIMGILTLFPMMALGLWLSIVLIGVGIVSIILGFLNKRKTLIKEEVKEIKQEEQAENKIEY
jgi:F0F1-type ATP synthase membrane subunit b/b'